MAEIIMAANFPKLITTTTDLGNSENPRRFFCFGLVWFYDRQAYHIQSAKQTATTKR